MIRGLAGRTGRALSVGLTVGLLASCAAAVPDPTPDDAAAAVCDKVMAALPDEVAGQTRNKPDQRFVRQWGGPPIVVRCGIPRPDALQPTSRCDVVNDVGWFAQTEGDDMRFTTIGREIYLDVFVPWQYRPEANVLVDLADAVKQSAVVTPCV